MVANGQGVSRARNLARCGVRIEREKPMANVTRYVKTEKGAIEIGNRGKNLRGRMRTMLFLIDASRTADELKAQAAQIGVEADFLDVLINEGYVVPIVQKATSRVAAGVAPAAASTRSTVA